MMTLILSAVSFCVLGGPLLELCLPICFIVIPSVVHIFFFVTTNSSLCKWAQIIASVIFFTTKTESLF